MNLKQGFTSAQQQFTKQEALVGISRHSCSPKLKNALPLLDHAQQRLAKPQPWGKVSLLYEHIQM